MNKLLLSASLAVVALTFVPAVQAASTSGNDAGFFVGARVGQGQFTGGSSDNTNTYSLDLGYRWAINGHNSLGFEAGYVKPKDIDYAYISGYGRLKSQAYTLGATYHFTFAGNHSGGHWFFAARVGYMHWNQDEKDTSYGSNYVGYVSSASGTGSYAGVGIGYDFNDHVGLGLNYDYYLSDVSDDGYGDYSINGLSVPSLGLEIRF
jgi:hypothetical protein